VITEVSKEPVVSIFRAEDGGARLLKITKSHLYKSTRCEISENYSANIRHEVPISRTAGPVLALSFPWQSALFDF
jgi:hypothetical protein